MTSSLFRYVRNASGVTPATRPEMNNTAGPPGSLDLKQWPSGRNSYNFADSFADYGRWMELWAHTARAAEAEMQAGGGGGSGGAGATFVRETWPLIQGMCKYTFMLHDVALAAKQARPATGLIVGPAEHDTCSSEAAFFSINAWTWRGWVEISRFLNDVASSPSASGWRSSTSSPPSTPCLPRPRSTSITSRSQSTPSSRSIWMRSSCWAPRSRPQSTSSSSRRIT